MEIFQDWNPNIHRKTANAIADLDIKMPGEEDIEGMKKAVGETDKKAK